MRRTTLMMLCFVLFYAVTPAVAQDDGVNRPSEQGEPDIPPTETEKGLQKRHGDLAPYYPTGAPEDVHIYFIGNKNKLFETKEDGWDIEPADDPFKKVISMPDPEQLSQPKRVQNDSYRVTIKPGETIQDIARRTLQRAGLEITPERLNRAKKGLKSANVEVDFERVVPGQTIRVPKFVRSEIEAQNWARSGQDKPDGRVDQAKPAQPTKPADSMDETDSRAESKETESDELDSTDGRPDALEPLPPIDEVGEGESGPAPTPQASRAGLNTPEVRYTVQSGDAVSIIARSHLREYAGQAPRSAINELTEAILRRNDITPKNLQVGQTITIPSFSLNAQQSSAQPSSAEDEQTAQEPSQQSPAQEIEGADENQAYTVEDSTTARNVVLEISRSVFGGEATRQMLGELQDNPQTDNRVSALATEIIRRNDGLQEIDDTIEEGTTIQVPAALDLEGGSQSRENGGGKTQRQAGGNERAESSAESRQYTAEDDITVRGLVIGLARSTFGTDEAQAMLREIQNNPQADNRLKALATEIIRRNDGLQEIDDTIEEGTTIQVPALGLESTGQDEQDGRNEEGTGDEQAEQAADTEPGAGTKGVEHTVDEDATVQEMAIGLARSAFGDSETRTMFNELRDNPQADNRLKAISEDLIQLNDELTSLNDTVTAGATIRIPDTGRY